MSVRTEFEDSVIDQLRIDGFVADSGVAKQPAFWLRDRTPVWLIERSRPYHPAL